MDNNEKAALKRALAKASEQQTQGGGKTDSVASYIENLLDEQTRQRFANLPEQLGADIKTKLLSLYLTAKKHCNNDTHFSEESKQAYEMLEQASPTAPISEAQKTAACRAVFAVKENLPKNVLPLEVSDACKIESFDRGILTVTQSPPAKEAQTAAAQDGTATGHVAGISEVSTQTAPKSVVYRGTQTHPPQTISRKTQTEPPDIKDLSGFAAVGSSAMGMSIIALNGLIEKVTQSPFDSANNNQLLESLQTCKADLARLGLHLNLMSAANPPNKRRKPPENENTEGHSCAIR